MLRTIGFLLDFSYDQRKSGVRTLTKDLLRLNKLVKGMVRGFKSANKEVSEEFEDMVSSIKSGSKGIGKAYSGVTAVLDSAKTGLMNMNNTVGAVASSLLNALTSPTAAVLGLGAAIAKTGKDIDAFGRGVRVSTNFTADQVSAAAREMTDVASQLGKSYTDAGAVALVFTSRLKSNAKDMKEFTKVALQLGDIARVGPEEIANQFARVSQEYKLGLSDIKNLAKTIDVTSKSVFASQGELIGNLQKIDSIMVNLPDAVKKKAIPDLVAAMGVLSNTTKDQTQLIDGVVRAFTDKTSDEFRRMGSFTAIFGNNLNEIQDSINKGNITDAMASVVKAMKAAKASDINAWATKFQEAFGISNQTVKDLANLDFDTFKKVAGALKDSAESSQYMEQAWKDSRSIGDKFWMTLNKSLNLIGDIFGEGGSSLLSKGLDGINKSLDWLHEKAKLIGDVFKSWAGSVGETGSAIISIGAGLVGMLGTIKLIKGIGGLVGIGGAAAATVGGAAGTGIGTAGTAAAGAAGGGLLSMLRGGVATLFRGYVLPFMAGWLGGEAIKTTDWYKKLEKEKIDPLSKLFAFGVRDMLGLDTGIKQGTPTTLLNQGPPAWLPDQSNLDAKKFFSSQLSNPAPRSAELQKMDELIRAIEASARFQIEEHQKMQSKELAQPQTASRPTSIPETRPTGWFK